MYRSKRASYGPGLLPLRARWSDRHAWHSIRTSCAKVIVTRELRNDDGDQGDVG